MITRETKIGLLVGLAFILVVGILLSEHVTTAEARGSAPLQSTGNDIRRAIDAPMAQSPSQPGVALNSDPQPSQRVATRDQLDVPAVPTPVDDGFAPLEHGGDQITQTPGDNGADTQQTGADGRAQLAGGLMGRAREMGAELVPLTAVHDPVPPAEPAAPTEPAGPAATGGTLPVREYVAQAGDSLNKLAGRFLGANTAANRQAILALNPQLQADPDRIIVGQKYLIPVRPDAPVAPTPAAQKPPAAAATYTVYVVKPGDSLWKIAQRECGDARLVDQIRALNHDLLGESDQVKVDMKLKLPGKKG